MLAKPFKAIKITLIDKITKAGISKIMWTLVNNGKLAAEGVSDDNGNSVAILDKAYENENTFSLDTGTTGKHQKVTGY